MRREKNRPYRAYLLRCWQEGEAAPDRKPHWRFSVEEILHKRRRQGFDSLETLVAFLRAELAGGEDGSRCTREIEDDKEMMQENVKREGVKREKDP